MPEQPEYEQAGEIYKRSMRESLEHLDRLNADLMKAKEAAIDQEIAAKEELNRIQRDAEKLSEKFFEQHQKDHDERVKFDVIRDVIEKLIKAGRTGKEIKDWLDVEEELIARMHTSLGFELLENHPATLWYDSKGRAGDVYFNWDGFFVKFPYEFAGGNSLATIDIPTEERWETETKLKSEKRMAVLEFVAKRIVRDQAPDHKYEIKPDHIRIFP